jgi:hypothetical protein
VSEDTGHNWSLLANTTTVLSARRRRRGMAEGEGVEVSTVTVVVVAVVSRVLASRNR